MSESVTVQRLAPRDTTMLRALLVVFGRAFDDVERSTAQQPDEAYLERRLASETFVAVAARAGTKPGTREDVLHFEIAPGAGES